MRTYGVSIQIIRFKFCQSQLRSIHQSFPLYSTTVEFFLFVKVIMVICVHVPVYLYVVNNTLVAVCRMATSRLPFYLAKNSHGAF